MGKFIRNGDVYGGCGEYARQIKVDTSSTTLSGDNLQDVVEEVDKKIDTSVSNLQGFQTYDIGKNSHTEGSGDDLLTDEEISSITNINSALLLYDTKSFLMAYGTNSHAEGRNSLALGNNSHAEGSSIASGRNSHAEGVGTASGNNSHAEGFGIANGNYSHAEGFGIANGNYSHAEGNNTIAKGGISHSEGNHCVSYGEGSHAEGSGTTLMTDPISSITDIDTAINLWTTKKFLMAFGKYSHAEGKDVLAAGDYSHTEGLCTVASGSYQHVEGKYNVANSNYAHITGGGTYDEDTDTTTRKNIYTLDWDGNAKFAGEVEDGSGNTLSSVSSVSEGTNLFDATQLEFGYITTSASRDGLTIDQSIIATISDGTITSPKLSANYGLVLCRKMPVIAGDAYTVSGILSAPSEVGVAFFNSNGGTITSYSPSILNNAYTFTIPDGIGYMSVIFRVTVSVSDGPLYFRNIMLEKGDIAHAYQPYIYGNNMHDAIINTHNIIGNGVINLLAYNINTLKPLNYAGVWNNNVYTLNNVTFTVNSDMTITVSGTATASTTFNLPGFTCIANVNYKVHGVPNPSKASTTTYGFSFGCSGGGSGGAGSLDLKFTFNSICSLGICIAKSYPVNNLIFKPMLETGTIMHTYVPGANLGGSTNILNSVSAINDDFICKRQIVYKDQSVPFALPAEDGAYRIVFLQTDNNFAETKTLYVGTSLTTHSPGGDTITGCTMVTDSTVSNQQSYISLMSFVKYTATIEFDNNGLVSVTKIL